MHSRECRRAASSDARCKAAVRLQATWHALDGVPMQPNCIRTTLPAARPLRPRGRTRAAVYRHATSPAGRIRASHSLPRHRVIPAVPFCHLTFSADRPVLRRYERVKVPGETLGGKLRQKRWERRLEQAEVAQILGVSTTTYRNWEVNRRTPRQSIAAVRNWLDS
jgi:DNA-binding XRE family transcriptional regulator